MRRLVTGLALGCILVAGCDSDANTASIQTSVERVSSQVGSAELASGGGRLKLSATAEIVFPLESVQSYVTLVSETTAIEDNVDFGLIAGVYTVGPAELDFQRPGRFVYTGPGIAENIGVVYRPSEDADWVGLPSARIGVDSDADGVNDRTELRAWLSQTGSIAVASYSEAFGACCESAGCSEVAPSACSGTFLGPATTCDSPGVGDCTSRCCLSAFSAGAAVTSAEKNIGACLSEDLWPLGPGSTCGTQCCSPVSGFGSVSKFTGLCSDQSVSTDCDVCCISDGEAKYTSPGACDSVDMTGGSCVTVCCASSVLSPVQGFSQVTRHQCASVSGFESVPTFCALCETATDCNVPPSSCYEAQGECVDNQCVYPALGECVSGTDCGPEASCTSACTCEG